MIGMHSLEKAVEQNPTEEDLSVNRVIGAKQDLVYGYIYIWIYMDIWM